MNKTGADFPRERINCGEVQIAIAGYISVVNSSVPGGNNWCDGEDNGR